MIFPALPSLKPLYVPLQYLPSRSILLLAPLVVTIHHLGALVNHLENRRWVSDAIFPVFLGPIFRSSSTTAVRHLGFSDNDHRALAGHSA